MVKVLTIRDPKTGALIAEEQIQPTEDKDSALTRIYRKSVGPDAPEFMVITKAIWLDDREWAAELAKDWSGFGLALLGPKGDPDLEKARLVLARVSEAQPVSRMEFPTDKASTRCDEARATTQCGRSFQPGEPSGRRRQGHLSGSGIRSLRVSSFGPKWRRRFRRADRSEEPRSEMGGARPLLHCMESSTGEEEAEKKRSTRVKVTRSSMDKKAAAGAVASFRELHGRLSRYGTGLDLPGPRRPGWELIPKAGRKPYLGHEADPF